MIRAPRRLLPDSSSPPIHRRRLPLPPLFRRRLSPLQASLVQALLCTGPIRGGRGLTPLGLLMDPAADGEGGGYEDASEFADAETGGGEVVRGGEGRGRGRSCRGARQGGGVPRVRDVARGGGGGGGRDLPRLRRRHRPCFTGELASSSARYMM